MSGNHSEADHLQKKVLLTVLALNFLLFMVLGIGGLMANSSALLANAVDNGSDAVVYLLSFLAVGRSLIWKQRTAKTSGIMLLVIAGLVLLDAVRRFIYGSDPGGWVMMGLAIVAAIINLICLQLIRGQKSEDVNMRAAETFSFNDFASNGGILVAGGLVMWLNQSWPDLVVGIIVAAIALKGGIDILRSTKEPQQASRQVPT